MRQVFGIIAGSTEKVMLNVLRGGEHLSFAVPVETMVFNPPSVEVVGEKE